VALQALTFLLEDVNGLKEDLIGIPLAHALHRDYIPSAASPVIPFGENLQIK
jgi:hypothetical protein